MNHQSISPHSRQHPAAKPFTPVPPPRRKRLLIVDDDHFIRELHALILSLEGYEIETAEDGIEALKQLAQSPFDLVLTDWEMPNLDGASMVLALRSAGSRMPIVMMSGSFAHKSLPRAVTREISVALPKPIRAAELRRAVALGLGRMPDSEESLSHLPAPSRYNAPPLAHHAP
jgi:CheY-like chemotaxis protein